MCLYPLEQIVPGVTFSGKSACEVLPCVVCFLKPRWYWVPGGWRGARVVECDASEHRLSPFYHHHPHEASKAKVISSLLPATMTTNKISWL